MAEYSRIAGRLTNKELSSRDFSQEVAVVQEGDFSQACGQVAHSIEEGCENYHSL